MKTNGEKKPADRDMIDGLMYNYSSQVNGVEEENRLLKQTVQSLKAELDRLQATPLLMSEVVTISDDQAVIRLPNGNSFLVNVSKEVGKIKPGDQVLVEQKNLNIIKKYYTSRKFDVEKFVIIEKPTVDWHAVAA